MYSLQIRYLTRVIQIIRSVCLTSMSGTMIYERRKLFIGRAMILMSASGIGTAASNRITVLLGLTQRFATKCSNTAI